jgi:hypothetical protein
VCNRAADFHGTAKGKPSCHRPFAGKERADRKDPRIKRFSWPASAEAQRSNINDGTAGEGPEMVAGTRCRGDE